MSAVPTVPQVFFSVHALCTWGSVNSVDRKIGTKPKKKKILSCLSLFLDI